MVASLEKWIYIMFRSLVRTRKVFPCERLGPRVRICIFWEALDKNRFGLVPFQMKTIFVSGKIRPKSLYSPSVSLKYKLSFIRLLFAFYLVTLLYDC